MNSAYWGRLLRPVHIIVAKLYGTVNLTMQTSVFDSHVHFWDPGQFMYEWLNGNSVLNRPYLPSDYRAATRNVHVDGIVFVQADCLREQGIAEARWVADLAVRESLIQAVVAYAPLEAGSALADYLDELVQIPLVRGVRRLLQGELNPEFCLAPHFVDGVKLLADYNLHFELCITHQQLPAAVELVRLVPEVRFVLNHLAKPAIKSGELGPWRTHLTKLAAQPNVWCKLSGLVTEADFDHWTAEELLPYVDASLNAFGPDRLMFGSDWPVCTLASSWERWQTTCEDMLKSLSDYDQAAIFYRNARTFYRISEAFRAAKGGAH